MSDFNSSLPVRTEQNGDVVGKLVDGITNTQYLAIDASGKIGVKLSDASGTGLTSTLVGSNQALDVLDAASGPVTPGTVAAYSNLIGGQYNSSLPTLTTGQQSAVQVDSSGRLIISPLSSTTSSISVSNFPSTVDTNYGVVGANTIRTAAQIGNATGAADFNAGATGAQTLRVSANQGAPGTAANGWFVKLTDGTNTVSITAAGEVKVDITQPLPAGTNNIGSVNQGTSPWITKDQADGSATGGTAGAFSMLAGGIYNSTPPTLTNGQQASLQLDASGRLIVVSSSSNDTNYGVVGANTLRTAAQIGNATGAADFNYGTVGAQTLRVAAQIGNATGAADFGAGATGAQTLRVVANLNDATGNPFSATNPLPVTIDTIPGTAVDDFKDASSVAANAPDSHDYTVTALKTFYFDQVIAAASGKAKMVVAIETGVATGIFNTKFVQFNSTADASMNFTLASPIAVAAGVRVRVTLTNIDKGSQDLYSTICGNEV